MPNSPATKFYKAKPGFANYYFNELEQERLLTAFHKHGDFSKATGDWSVRTTGTLLRRRWTARQARRRRLHHQEQGRQGSAERSRSRPSSTARFHAWSRSTTTRSRATLPRPARQRRPADGPVSVSPAAGVRRQGLRQRLQPRRHRAVLSAARRPGASPTTAKLRVDAEVLRTTPRRRRRPSGTSRRTRTTRPANCSASRCWLDRDEDPCEVYLFDYKDVDGGKLPHRIRGPLRRQDRTRA